ncbi:MAG: hypothetical protein HY897_13270, partial [Deltaproteobacteria bacterium]|nr:hypothetical protein [Deltaproteobacteria bacterium]
NVQVFGDEPVLSGIVQSGVFNVPPALAARRNVFSRFWSWLSRRRPPEDSEKA